MTVKESYIHLHNLRFHAYHGVLAQERRTGGEFVVNVRVAYPLRQAMQTDNVDDTLNYAELFEIINKEMQTPSSLLEHVAGRIGESIFRHFAQVSSVWLTIAKKNPPMGADSDGAAVEVLLER
ncbi:MAG: dihydroneopterin aldolase [Prevotella sp.]|jgi:dihydroneopterin aldolase|nr:dihydroneopterin aldolase [Prevotella sp.]